MWQQGRLAACAASLALLAGCASTGEEPPKPVKSEYFQTQHAVFQADSDGGHTYSMVLQVLKPLPPRAVLEVWMQNPQPGARGIQTTLGIRPADDILTIQSRPLRGLVRGHTYHTTVLVYAGPAKSELLATHEQPIRFDPD